MKRVYFHYSDQEEFAAGLWEKVTGARHDRYVDAAAALMREVDCFKDAMLRALDEWPNSCRANLTSSSTNQRAWLGHAGCFLATGSPEESTRLGWHRLTLEEQTLANEAADQVIAEWQARQRRDREDLGLFSSDTPQVHRGTI